MTASRAPIATSRAPRRFLPTEPFVPAQGLEHPHAQTIFAHVRRPRHAPPLERERWELPDGDFIDVDRLMAPLSAPHIVVVHGLEGSSRASYVTSLLRPAHAAGFGAIAMNLRGCSGTINRLPRAYHSGDTLDLGFVVDKLARQLTGPLLLAGFSLGANQSLRYLGERGNDTPIAAAACMSPPFDLVTSSRLLDGATGVGLVYKHRFLRSLRAKAMAKATRFPTAVNRNAVANARSLRAFDDAFTAAQHGFRDAQDYYERASSGPLLATICRPTLILSSADDPIAPAMTLPATAHENPWLVPVLTAKGGHVGFVAGTWRQPRFWGEEQMWRFLAAATCPR